MILEVTMVLYDASERALFEKFVDEIDKLRDDEPPVPAPVFAGSYDAPATKLTTAPTQAQMEEAVKAYGRAKGFPAARALLDEYTKGKIGDVPADKRAELYARMTA